jgi:hypothetical protein
MVVPGFFKRLALLALFLCPVASHAQWREVETAHFIIYSESSEREIEKLAERLESFDGLMRLATNMSDDVEPVKVRIYEVESTEDVQAALGLTASGVAGFYDSNALGPFAVTPRKTHSNDPLFSPELVLHHEYAHHFMLQYFPAVYPSWYVEGFAELIGSSRMLPNGKIGYGMPARHRGNELVASWVPIPELLLTPPHKLRNFDTYGQGWALTHFFTFTPERAAQLRQYLAALHAGRPPAEAAKAFGDLQKLDRDARRYVVAGSFAYRPVAVPIQKPVIKRSRMLGPGEAALIPEVVAFRDDELTLYREEKARNREKALRDATLARTRAKAARFAADPFALHFLAQSEYAAGNYSAAEAAADRLIALQPQHARGLVLKSLTVSRAAAALSGPARASKAAEARRLALKANRADPNDPVALLAFYQSFHLAGEKPTREAVTGLMQVVATLPSDTQARQLLIDQLAAEKRFGEAIAYLQPIANSPYESPRRQAAREQMAKLMAELAKQAPAPAPAPAAS